MLLWFLAPRIAGLLTKELPLDCGFLSAVDGYTIAFAGIGLYFTFHQVGAVFFSIISLFQTCINSPNLTWTKNVSWLTLYETSISFIIGIVIIIFARKWAFAITRLEEKAI